MEMMVSVGFWIFLYFLCSPSLLSIVRILAAKSFYVTVFHKSHFSHYCAIMAPYSKYLYCRVEHEEQSGACLTVVDSGKIGKLLRRFGRAHWVTLSFISKDTVWFASSIAVILLWWIIGNTFPVSVQLFQQILETDESVNTPLIFANASAYLEFLPVIESKESCSSLDLLPRNMRLTQRLSGCLSAVSWSHQDTPHSLSQAGRSRQIPAPEPP